MNQGKADFCSADGHLAADDIPSMRGRAIGASSR